VASTRSIALNSTASGAAAGDGNGTGDPAADDPAAVEVGPAALAGLVSGGAIALAAAAGELGVADEIAEPDELAARHSGRAARNTSASTKTVVRGKRCLRNTFAVDALTEAVKFRDILPKQNNANSPSTVTGPPAPRASCQFRQITGFPLPG
jgi:hypothetical protein